MYPSARESYVNGVATGTDPIGQVTPHSSPYEPPCVSEHIVDRVGPQAIEMSSNRLSILSGFPVTPR